MEILIKEINKLNMGEAHSLIGLAFNRAMEFECGTEERKVWEEISDLATKRFAKLYANASKRKQKASARVDFGKYEHEDIFGEIEYRQLTVDVTLTAETEDEVEALWEKFTERLEEVADVETNWSACPTIGQSHKTGAWYYCDSFVVDYDHGMMTEIKKDFMKDFKAVKKEMGIR